jgi:hypothetical protein
MKPQASNDSFERLNNYNHHQKGEYENCYCWVLKTFPIKFHQKKHHLTYVCAPFWLVQFRWPQNQRTVTIILFKDSVTHICSTVLQYFFVAQSPGTIPMCSTAWTSLHKLTVAHMDWLQFNVILKWTIKLHLGIYSKLQLIISIPECSNLIHSFPFIQCEAFMTMICNEPFLGDQPPR